MKSTRVGGRGKSENVTLCNISSKVLNLSKRRKQSQGREFVVMSFMECLLGNENLISKTFITDKNG